MTKFCGACGSPLPETAIYCGGCGAAVAAAQPASRAQQPASLPPVTPDPASWATVALPASHLPPANPDPVVQAQAPPPYQVPQSYQPQPAYQAPQAYQAPPASYASAPAPAGYAPAIPYPAKKSNTLLKVVIAVVVLLCVGCALALGGLYYGAQMLRQKVHQVAAQQLGGSSVFSGNDSGEGFKGDPCRFLSKAEVSQAVGLVVIRTDAKDDGCSYIAKGDPADVTAKHAAAMLGGMGADAQTQKTIQKFAGAIFAQQEAGDKSLSAEATTGEVPVLVISFTSGNAQMEMKMNRGVFGAVADPSGNQKAGTQTSTGALTGIGDEAYVAGGSMILVRKGNTVAHFTYISCPCNTGNIKPLAQMVASRL
jgi:hypothetical protein